MEKIRNRIHSFKGSARKGKAGENQFLDAFKDLEPMPQGIKGPDFKIKDEDILVELKTDYYSMETGNFFMEVYSDMEKKSPGGPKQALKKGSNVFCYYYIQSGDVFVFTDLKELCKRITKVKKKGRECKIKNKNYTTLGYAINREEFKDLYKKINIDQLRSKSFKSLL